MQPDQVRKHLRAYRENKARIAHYETQADEIRRGIWAENQPAMQAIHAQSYDLHIRSWHSSPTERCLEGRQTASAKVWAEELRQLDRETQEARFAVAYVDAWLCGLTEKEQKAITAHEIDGLSWQEVSFESPELLGYYMSPDGLRRIGKLAIEKICRIAR